MAICFVSAIFNKLLVKCARSLHFHCKFVDLNGNKICVALAAGLLININRTINLGAAMANERASKREQINDRSFFFFFKFNVGGGEKDNIIECLSTSA